MLNITGIVTNCLNSSKDDMSFSMVGYKGLQPILTREEERGEKKKRRGEEMRGGSWRCRFWEFRP